MQGVQNSFNRHSTVELKREVEDDQIIKKKLFNHVMKGEWSDVVQIYRHYKWIHKTKITRSGGTALHIAVADGREEFVEQLVDIVREQTSEALGIGDELGNTPLHKAAMLGNMKMCKCLAREGSTLVGARNQDSETPFFMAASHGHKRAFLYLHSLCEGDQGYEYSRRNNGETILHCAISGDYFDLAFQIIHLYKKLVNSVNERGLSPLHLLAAKPSAFRSGIHLGRFKGIVYHCIFVDKLEAERFDHQSPQQKSDKQEPRKLYPPNYETSYDFIKLLLKAIKLVVQADRGCTEKGGKPADAGDLHKEVAQADRGCTENGGKPADADLEDPHKEGDESSSIKAQGHQLLPSNYSVCFEFVKLVSKAMLIILGLGSNNIRKLREKKQKNTWSVQVMNKLLHEARMYEYEDDGKKPLTPPSSVLTPPSPVPEEESKETKPYTIGAGGNVEKTFVKYDSNQQPPTATPPTNHVSGANKQKQKVSESSQVKNQAENKEEISEMEKKESPILIAAKNGITEIVEKILENFPVAIHDMNYQKKNVVLLAVENRQPHVYHLLLKITNLKESVFRKVDHDGNSALHLAARLGDHKPWLIPGSALQMQWEIKWYKFVKDSMPFHFFARYNKANKSPRDVFTDTHQELVKAGGDWLTNTSESCSVVAALIATVAFATSATVPGGVKSESGTPTLVNQPAFNIFAIASLVALCFSVTAVVMFLAILTSRYQERDFGIDLPRKLLVGLTSLFVSIASMLVSFCAGHFFVLKDKLKYAAIPVYAVTCLPITFFAIAQFPLYIDLVWAIFKKVPQRSYKSIHL